MSFVQITWVTLLLTYIRKQYLSYVIKLRLRYLHCWLFILCWTCCEYGVSLSVVSRVINNLDFCEFCYIDCLLIVCSVLLGYKNNGFRKNGQRKKRFIMLKWWRFTFAENVSGYIDGVIAYTQYSVPWLESFIALKYEKYNVIGWHVRTSWVFTFVRQCWIETG